MGSWEEKVTQFMLEEEEDDDELFFVLIPALLSGIQEEKRLVRNSSLPGRIKVREILEGHEKWCRFEFRMEPEIFRATANFLRRENLLRDTRGVAVEEQLGMFMYMLSHNGSTDMICKAFQHSGETVHRKITEVFDIIPALTHRFVRLPSSNHTHAKIATDPRFMPFFQNCIGAIDGTHIPITISEDKTPPYRNRNGTLSQNVMLVCNFDLNFTFISCGWEGSASDAGVLRSAICQGFRVPNGKFYLVDGGYVNTSSFIAPYLGVRYHLNEFRGRRSSQRGYANYKELFNHRHAILRNHIERAIGVLKKRFTILKVGTHHPIKNQIKIVMAKESSRAIWNSIYEKGLVDILLEHNLNPKFKGQNGWVTEGWRSIASKFNEGFPLAHFTKQQIQEKEKELKGNYKAIRDARKESGVGWNDSLGMIIAVDEVWSRIINAHPKVKKFRGKPFPLFNNLALLYEGSVATGDLNFTSTQRMDIPVERTISQKDIQLLPRTSEPNDNIDVCRNPFSTSFSGQGASSEHLETYEAQSVQSNQSSRHEDGKGGKKRKQSQVASVLGDYLEFKKDQSTSTLEDLKEKKRREEEFSVANCVDALEAMDDLTDEQKADALELFKCDLNRQLFIKTKNPNVRRIWLMKRIAP
ncbi:hypothetical protein ACP4OV_031964 [Aristida adscensionis]